MISIILVKSLFGYSFETWDIENNTYLVKDSIKF